MIWFFEIARLLQSPLKANPIEGKWEQMDGKRLLKGYIVGWIALLIELGFFGGSIVIDLLRGISPETASQLSSMLTNMATIGLLMNFFAGTLAVFNIGGWRDGSLGFLAGILTVIMIFGALLGEYAPQVMEGLWGSFFAMLLPIIITIILALIVWIWRESREHEERYYY